MKRFLITGVLALSLSLSTHAQAIPAAVPYRTADKAWWLINAASVGMTAADIENTQYCLRDPRCQEGNPIYFSRRPSRLRMYAINSIWLVPEIYYSYKWKREDDIDRYNNRPLAKYRWYVIPIINIATHGAGITITLTTTGR